MHFKDGRPQRRNLTRIGNKYFVGNVLIAKISVHQTKSDNKTFFVIFFNGGNPSDISEILPSKSKDEARALVTARAMVELL